MPLLSLPMLAGAVLAVLVGVSLGLLGGGGSILTVPIVVYVLGVPAHDAIATSLLVVGATSAAALVPHARAGRVRWQTGALFGATSMLSAFAAGKLSHLVPASLLLSGFGAIMLVSAAGMMRGKREVVVVASGEVVPELPAARLPIGRIAVQGLAVGALTGLIGAGGGFVVVPALVLLGKLPMRAAVGTSLLVIAMNSVAGFAGHAPSAHVEWGVVGLLSAAAIGGSVVGSALVARVPDVLLRRGFGWFVIAMAVLVLLQEIPRALGSAVELGWAWILAASAVPCVLAVIDLWGRARAPSPAQPG